MGPMRRLCVHECALCAKGWICKQRCAAERRQSCGLACGKSWGHHEESVHADSEGRHPSVRRDFSRCRQRNVRGVLQDRSRGLRGCAAGRHWPRHQHALYKRFDPRDNSMCAILYDESDFRSQKLHEFNTLVKNDDRVEQVVLTIREGMTMIKPKRMTSYMGPKIK